jgi:hypothetical protein
LLADLAGATGERALNRIGARALARMAPVAGRPRPVITIPGFMATAESLAPMNDFLNRQGFTSRAWALGRNRGLEGASWSANLDRIRRRLADQARALADECSAPVSLVGHSLGGVYARELAHHLEGEIDRVITLGSPTFHPYRRDRHNQVIQAIGTWVNRQRATEFGGRAGLLHWDADRPRLPCVAIHSPIDGFVHESACHIPGYIVAQSSRKAPRENVRVLATHTGMTVSVWVLLAVADRLAADRRKWVPFDPGAYFPPYLGHVARCVYPPAEELWRDRGIAAFVRMNQ